MHHPQVVQSPIVNDCLKVKDYGHTEPKLVPTLLLHLSVRELNRNLVSDIDNGGLKESRDEDNNIIISDSTLSSLLSPQFKIMSSRYKVMCSCKCCISSKSMHLPLLSWRVLYLKKTQGLQPKFSKQKVWGKRKSYI